MTMMRTEWLVMYVLIFVWWIPLLYICNENFLRIKYSLKTLQIRITVQVFLPCDSTAETRLEGWLGRVTLTLRHCLTDEESTWSYNPQHSMRLWVYVLNTSLKTRNKNNLTRWRLAGRKRVELRFNVFLEKERRESCNNTTEIVNEEKRRTWEKNLALANLKLVERLELSNALISHLSSENSSSND